MLEARDLAVDRIRGAVSRLDLSSSGAPYYGEGTDYTIFGQDHWAVGFWPGLLWQAAAASRDARIAENAAKASETTRSWVRRVGAAPFGHDLGFVMLLTARLPIMAMHRMSGPSPVQAAALHDEMLWAARELAARYHEAGGVIQAHGPVGEGELASRVIIDTLMNLPLLWEAARAGGGSALGEIADRHARTALAHQLRADGSVAQVIHVNPTSGKVLGPGRLQGLSPASTWSRGQAWAIYGWTLAYEYTGWQPFLEAARRAARYFISRALVPGVAVWVPWDFDDPRPEAPGDTSAMAIAASALLELAGVDAGEASWRETAVRLLAFLADHCLAPPGSLALLAGASYHVPAGRGVNGVAIWGDYFYLEALNKVTGVALTPFAPEP